MVVLWYFRAALLELLPLARFDVSTNDVPVTKENSFIISEALPLEQEL